MSLLFPQGMGGFAGNIMALVCIFSGLIASGVCNIRASREVARCAARLGIDKKDLAEARRHVKNGTVAWSGGEDSCTAGAQISREAAVGHGGQKALPETASRAVWAAAMIFAGWIALLALQSIVGTRATFNANALYLMVAALLGAGVYLVSKRKWKYKLIGVGAGLLAALLNALSVVCIQGFRRGKPMRFEGARIFRDVFFTNTIGGALLFMLLALAVAMIVSRLYKGANHRRGMRLSALSAGFSYFVCNVGNAFYNPHIYLGSLAARNVVNAIFTALAWGTCVYLVAMAVFALANMPAKRVRLRGIGLAWAWLAATRWL